jgi:hypothetical protein
MNWLLILLNTISMITLTGCAYNASQAPIPIAHEKAWQRKMQAAHHWSLLAEYQAGLILKAINNLSKPIYIDMLLDNESNPFERAYHDMLQSHLVKKGGLVVTEPAQDNVLVSYSTQVIEHQDRPYVVLNPGVLAAPPVQPVLENPFWRYYRIDPTEVIITTKVVEGMLILHSSSDIFYYNQGDTNHYGPHTLTKNVTFKVTDDTQEYVDEL